jgi:para-nitrobenzyl esterase
MNFPGIPNPALVCVLLLGAVFPEGTPPAPNTVTEEAILKDGPIRGQKIDASLIVFRGIPYAAPPVGPLRWKPPQPFEPWKEPRDATRFGNACHQPANDLLGPSARVAEPKSEDCLYLNIWTAATRRDEKRPVMVWIHGGGFTTGAGSMAMYDGGTLARAGVVLVTINYRLGPFGFFAHPSLSRESPRGVSGNYGLLDQIQALTWVRDNIERFGGDPGKVTIFGESAGSAAVCRLMVSPLSQGLFHRAIAQSGGAHGRNPYLRQSVGNIESAESMGERLARKLGCDAAEDPLDALRKISAGDLLDTAAPAVGLYSQGDKYRPVVDGWVLPDDPGRLFNAGKAHHIPLIIGSNADEGTIFVRQIPIKGILGYRLFLRSVAGDRAGNVERLFPVASEAEIQGSLNKLTTAFAFAAPARAIARALDRQDTPAYLYHFTKVPPSQLLKPYGAFHSLEIAYVFGNFRGALTAGPADKKLSDAMRAYWIQFAETGNPNHPALPRWPQYAASSDAYLELGEALEIKTGLYREACDIYDSLTEEFSTPAR